MDDAAKSVEGVKGLLSDTVVSTEQTRQPDADIARGRFTPMKEAQRRDDLNR